MEQIRLSQEFFEETAIGIVVTTTEHEIIAVNPSMENMSGYSNAELVGMLMVDLRIGRGVDGFFEEYKEVIKEVGYWEGEDFQRNSDGELTLKYRFAYKVKDEAHGEVIVMFTVDGSDEKMVNEKTRDLYYKDAITGLPNRNVFMEIFERSLRKSERRNRMTSFIILDVDRFSKINESFGFEEGDKLLRKIAERLRDSAGGDVIITRLASDTFAMTLPEATREEEVMAIIERINHSFRVVPFEISDNEIYVSITMGVSFYPQDGKSREELLRTAEIAKGKAKESGATNYHFYKPDMNSKAIELVLMESSLRRAVHEREFELYLQPQVHIESGKISGAEALIRWNHPELGVVSPNEFIPLAERTGLIVPIGIWVIEEACKILHEWDQHEMTKGMTLAINLSPVQFGQEDLLKIIDGAVEKYGVDSRRLEFEITENVMMDEAEKSSKKIEDMKRLGVYVSMDDFGTGYSNLSFLAKFPIDYLKIDRSLLENVASSESDRIILAAIIKMANDLGLSVVAEGVETEEQLEFLRESECTYYQGFYLSKPIRENQFLELLHKHNGN